MERAALQRDDAFAGEGLTAIDQSRERRAVSEGYRGDRRGILLVRLGEIRRVSAHRHALPRHPGDGAARVEPARKRDPHARAGRRKRTIDTAHARADTTGPCGSLLTRGALAPPGSARG